MNFQKKVDDKSKMSKRKLKKLTRLSVAELKQLVNRPDVVEMHDVTARDPKLLVQLKAHRNTVQVYIEQDNDNCSASNFDRVFLTMFLL